jgi:phage baseplate assembly protein W
MLFTNSIRFPNIFNTINGSTEIEKEYTSINRCIALILTTAKGELLMNPDFGCNLYEQLFAIVDEELWNSVKTSIVESITTFEKRVTLNTQDIEITPIEGTKTAFNINIKYKVVNSDLTNEVSVNLTEEDFTK